MILLCYVAGHSSLQTPSSHTSHPGSASGKRTAPASKSGEANVFNFGEARVQEYLSSLSSSESSDSNHAAGLLLSPPPKKRKPIPAVDPARPGSSRDVADTLVCRLSQTEFGHDLEVGSYEQVSDRLPSVSDSDTLRLGVSVEQSVGPLTRSKRRKLESDSSPDSKRARKDQRKAKSRRHRKHHHRSKHHKHRPQPKQPDVITID